MKILKDIQKEKIKEVLNGKNLGLFFLWIVIFSTINFHFNEIGDVGLGIFSYKWWVSIPYIFFLIINTILIALSINLIIRKIKEIKSLNPKAGVFSILGTFLALLTGACPGCIAGIFPAFIGIFGSNISLYSLPLYGIELQILSFVFLLIGVYYLSSNIICKIKTKRKHMKKLYLAYMGGRSLERLMEDHEIIMVVSDNLEDAKSKAKEKTKLKDEVHIDMILELKNIDGYNISLEKGGEEDFKKVLDYTKI